jgi:hypothetical protein
MSVCEGRCILRTSIAPVHLPTGKDLRAAMDAVLSGTPAPKSRPSIGCNIKWIPEQEPAYYGIQIVKGQSRIVSAYW